MPIKISRAALGVVRIAPVMYSSVSQVDGVLEYLLTQDAVFRQMCTLAARRVTVDGEAVFM